MSLTLVSTSVYLLSDSQQKTVCSLADYGGGGQTLPKAGVGVESPLIADVLPGVLIRCCLVSPFAAFPIREYMAGH
jgi:hypothetical protein